MIRQWDTRTLKTQKNKITLDVTKHKLGIRRAAKVLIGMIQKVSCTTDQILSHAIQQTKTHSRLHSQTKQRICVERQDVTQVSEMNLVLWTWRICTNCIQMKLIHAVSKFNVKLYSLVFIIELLMWTCFDL